MGKIKLKRRKRWVVGVWVINLREGRLESEARRQVCAGVQGKGVGVEALRQGSLGGSGGID